MTALNDVNAIAWRMHERHPAHGEIWHAVRVERRKNRTWSIVRTHCGRREQVLTCTLRAGSAQNVTCPECAEATVLPASDRMTPEQAEQLLNAHVDKLRKRLTEAGEDADLIEIVCACWSAGWAQRGMCECPGYREAAGV